MDRLSMTRTGFRLLLFAFIFLFLNSSFAYGQNPNSGQTNTGQTLTVNILSPSDGTVLNQGPPCEAAVQGLATLSPSAKTGIKVLYVMDVSGSTADPTFYPPIDVNSDGVINELDDYNNDGFNGLILDAEIAGILALNENIQDFSQVSVGVIAFASRAAAAGVVPPGGFNYFTSPPLADLNNNAVPDMEEVARSLNSNFLLGGEINLFEPVSRDSLGNSTNFEAAIEAIIAACTEQGADDDKPIVFMLSDGSNETGGDLTAVLSEAASLGITINTIGITDKSDPSSLTEIAEATGGTFIQVEMPEDLQTVLPALPVAGLQGISVNGQQVELTAIGTFSTMVSVPGGASDISATAIADDDMGSGNTEVTAVVQVTCPEMPACSVEIVSHGDGQTVCENEATIEAEVSVSGQIVQEECFVNGEPADLVNGVITATVPLQPGANQIVVECSFVDAQGNETECSASISILHPQELACEAKILSPADGTNLTCSNVVEIVVDAASQGGAEPVTSSCTVNGIDAVFDGQNFVAFITPGSGETTITAICTFVDACGNQVLCTDEITITCIDNCVDFEKQAVGSVFGASAGDAPGDEFFDENGIAVRGELFTNEADDEVFGDATIEEVMNPPFGVGNFALISNINLCFDFSGLGTATVVTFDFVDFDGIENISVNGEPAFVGEIFEAPSDIAPGVTLSFAVATDGIGRATLMGNMTELCVGGQEFALDNVCVVQKMPPVIEPECALTIVDPEDGALVCEESITLVAELELFDITMPVDTSFQINGEPVEPETNGLEFAVTLSPGENTIELISTIIDASGSTTTCGDTITVFRDAEAPTCAWQVIDGEVKGVFMDDGGIVAIDPIKLRNAELLLDGFTQGAKVVNFTLRPMDPDKSMGFSIDVTDSCGNVFNCDPVFLNMTMDHASRRFDFTFPDVDRYLQLTNFGLTRVNVELNGGGFGLTTDQARAHHEPNTFLMPAEGMLTIDLGPYLEPGENHMVVTYEGGPGARAEFLLLDQIGYPVDFELELKMLPDDFALTQNYPNPFNPTTKIQFDIPASVSGATEVKLQVFNLLGEVIRTLVDEQRTPGRYTVEWDAKDDKGRPVSTGIYIYRIKAGEFTQANRMVLLK